MTRDIGGAIERYEKYKFDKMIYVVSSQQDLHLAQFFKILELMKFPWAASLQHINYGLVQGMSTRRGTVVFLDQIIREAAQVMHEQMQKNEEKYKAIEDPETVSREIGITGVKIQDMAAKRCVLFQQITFLTFDDGTQNQQLYVQLGPHEILRRRHGPIPSIRARPAVFHLAEKPSPHSTTASFPNRYNVARRLSTRAGDRIFAGHVS